MRIRQFIAAIMILLSLSAQARTSLACGMTPAVALAQCCCPAESRNQSPAADAQHCCDQLAAPEALLAHDAAGFDRHHAPAAANELPPVAAFESHWLPASFDRGDRTRAFLQPGTERRRVRPLYLQTARLRL